MSFSESFLDDTTLELEAFSHRVIQLWPCWSKSEELANIEGPKLSAQPLHVGGMEGHVIHGER